MYQEHKVNKSLQTEIMQKFNQLWGKIVRDLTFDKYELHSLLMREGNIFHKMGSGSEIFKSLLKDT